MEKKNSDNKEEELDIGELYKEAFEELKLSLSEKGVPIGAALYHKPTKKVIARGHNMLEQKGWVVMHAETNCIENTGRQNEALFRECVFFTTLSPCSMCSGTILLYKIPHVVVGENQNYNGKEDFLRSKGVKVDVLNDPDTIEIFSQYAMEKGEYWEEIRVRSPLKRKDPSIAK